MSDNVIMEYRGDQSDSDEDEDKKKMKDQLSSQLYAVYVLITPS